MNSVLLFPFAKYWWLDASITAFVLFMLALDLGVFHRTALEVSLNAAATWSVFWVSLAPAFGLLIYPYALWKFPFPPVDGLSGI